MKKKLSENKNRNRKAGWFPSKERDNKKSRQCFIYFVEEINPTDKKYRDRIEGGLLPSLATGDPTEPSSEEANKPSENHVHNFDN